MSNGLNVDEARDAGRGGPRRLLRGTIRRKGLWIVAVFCVVLSAALMTAPRLHRSYDLGGTVRVHTPAFEGIPELDRAAKGALEQTRAMPEASQVKSVLEDSAGGSVRVLRLEASSESREQALARIRYFAEKYGTNLERLARDAASGYRDGLEQSAKQLAEQEQKQSRSVDGFRLSHRGALPGDPASIFDQFDKLNAQFHEKQSRALVVTQQIARLGDYKKASEANGGRGVGAPPTTDGATPAVVAVKPENDPEVVTLTAQMQLLNDQVEEQLTKMGRKEQHPYVVDLRNQQAALRKKLDAAKERAAAGKPAPMPAHVVDGGETRGVDATLAGVDTELQKLQAEHDALDVEVRTLGGQRDAMMKQLDDVMPIRQEYEKLTDALSSTQKERQLARGKMEEFDRKFGSTAKDKAEPLTEITPLSLDSTSTLPSFPRPGWVYGVSIGLALGAAILAAFMLHQVDRGVHSTAEAAGSLEVPILGTVSVIHTRGEENRLRLWRMAGRPAVLVGLVVLVVFSVMSCYSRLADPDFARPAAMGAMDHGSFVAQASE